MEVRHQTKISSSVGRIGSEVLSLARESCPCNDSFETLLQLYHMTLQPSPELAAILKCDITLDKSEN
jgi:hypothetical protein